MTMATIVCEGLVKIFKTSDIEVVALQGLDLHVDPGELIAVVGASGSGKSTLLNVLGGLDTPTAGTAMVAGHDLTSLGRAERNHYRRSAVGFVWQQAGRNLLPYLTARRNIEMPMALAGASSEARWKRSSELLELVDLADRSDHVLGELSGGEQQRVAVATALANEPAVLLADEPTGELDVETSKEVLGVIRVASAELGVTAVLVTHDPLISEQVDRTVSIRDGRTSSETLRTLEEVEPGEHNVIAREFAVLDRAGRLQLPADYVEALELEKRVRLELEPDHIGVWPESDQPSRTEGEA